MDRTAEPTDVNELKETIRALEFVAFAAMNRGYFREDYQMREAASKGLAMAHKVLGMTHPRDEPRRKFDAKL